MMAERLNPFANLMDAPPIFEPKPKAAKPVQADAIERIAKENNFPSRPAIKPITEKSRKRRVYTTGRNRQFNIKATTETIERFCKMADERKLALCELLEAALDALERTGASNSN